jgi:hypothetical protein
MKPVLKVVTVLVGVFLSGFAFAQSENATLSGTVADASGASIPGVTVTATNTQTGVVTNVLSNESGAYNFASLQPGTYKASAELPGFRTQTYTNVTLGTSQQVRLNFTLQVGGVAQAVDVTVAADTLLATSSSSVGGVLAETTVQELPLVGRDALDLVPLLPGSHQADSNLGASRDTATFAGVYAGFGAVNTTRDGVSVSDGRYELGVFASSHISPELVGEMRVIVAPVDAETGRGVGQVQILTRSGTNQYRGVGVWNIQNQATDANSWANKFQGLGPTWYNRQQLTAGVGGPIKKNKTFFFVLVDGQRMFSRLQIVTPVLTAQARQGNFRFFPGVNNGNVDQAPGGTGNTAIAPVVDISGNPVQPAAATGPLQTVSVFQRDPNRLGADTSGFIQKMLAGMPLPNNFKSGSCIQILQAASCAATAAAGLTSLTDGLNVANFVWVRRGDTIVGNQFGTEPDTNRTQANFKIDHNFNQSHKFSVSYTWERDTNVASPSPWPGGYAGSALRGPQVLTTSFVSTLSPSLLNEVRVGFRRSKSGNRQPCDIPAVRDSVLAFLPDVNGYPLMPQPVNFANNEIPSGCNTVTTNSPMWTFNDSVSWTKSKHAFKGGAEIRLASTQGYSEVSWIPQAIGGAGNFPVVNIETALIPGLIGNNLTNARNLLLTLSGSIASISQSFRLYQPTASTFQDWLGAPSNQPPSRQYVQNEWSAFFKDDWKVRSALTLNLGIRYDFYAVPYEAHGFTSALVGGGLAGFGYTGRSWSNFWQYGQQNGPLTAVQFVGPHSPNPGSRLYNNDWTNFAPAVGFSWSFPWFGKDKTTVRGGYGISFLGTAGEGSSIDSALSAPGTIDNETFTSTSYLNLSNIKLPVPHLAPLQPLPLTQRTQPITTYDPNLRDPYIQTFNFSVTRTFQKNLTLDVRYVGTKGTKLFGSVPLNQPNYLTNGLLDALNVTRAGGNAPLFDQMLNGLNLNPGVAGFGAVGSVVNGVLQTGSMHLRQSTTYRANIANGNFAAVANSFNTSTQITGQGGGLLQNGGLPPNFIVNNPQFSSVTFGNNPGSSIYHSLQTQLTFRRTNGFTYQAVYVWSKALSNCFNPPACSTWANVLNRQLDRTVQSSDRRNDFRLFGSYELPLGQGHSLLGNSNGVISRLAERWQLSWITNWTSGAPLSLTATNTYLGYGRPQIVGPFSKNQGKALETAGLPVYFAPGTYKSVTDPQCASVTPLQGLQTACTNLAIQNAQGQILLQNATPGTLGNLGQNWLTGPLYFRLDMSVSKTVRIKENKILQLRVDAQNVLNHPIFSSPNLNINDVNFGQITASNVTGSRTLQTQLRFNF